MYLHRFLRMNCYERINEKNGKRNANNRFDRQHIREDLRLLKRKSSFRIIDKIF